MADFETTPDVNDCRVWLWCAADIDDTNERYYGTDIESFFEKFKHGVYTIYFHNLKFDGQFLLSYMINILGMEYNKDPQTGEFSTIISDNGIFYKIEAVFKRKGRHVDKIIFLDSFKKLPFKVKDIAPAFGLEETKGEIDHKMQRPKGYEPTQNEIEYVTNDVIIVAKALKSLFDEGLTAMTMSSDGLKYCKDILTKKTWEHYFPILDIEIDDFIRKAYKGGVVMVHPDRMGVEVYNGHSFDKNSMYPWAMTLPMPYGMPIWFDGEYKEDEQYPLYIQCICCEFVVKPGYLPTIQIKKNPLYIATDYISSSDGPTMLYLTSVDLRLFFDHYEVYNYKYMGGMKFKSVTGIFDPYVDHWYSLKKEAKGARRQIAKLMLNAFYGKTASRTRVSMKIPYADDEQVIRYKLAPEETKNPVYTAVAAFITSYGRESVIRSAQALGGSRPDSHFCYMDTDSVHVVGISVEDVGKIIDVDPKKLGAWKHEYSFERAKYIRQKCYIEEIAYHAGTESYAQYVEKMSGLSEEEQKKLQFELGKATYYEYVKKCAGMTEEIKNMIKYDEFEIGFTDDHLKLKPHYVKGGVVLTPTKFTMKG